MTRRVLVIWNANAGTKAGIPTNGASEEDLRRAMAGHDLDAEIYPSHTEEAGVARVRAGREQGFDAIVAAGGDGTVHAVALELLGGSTPLGILPLGSAMNVARALGVPFELDEAARVLAGGSVRRIDVGEANGEVFFEAVSVGLNAAVFGEAQRIDEGRWASIVDMVRFGLRYPPHRMSIDLDGRSEVVRALTLAVLNGPYTGLGLTLAPDARLDDGLLDVAIFEGMSRWALALHLVRVIGGRRAWAPGIRRRRARRIRVTARHSLPVRADATDLGRTPVDVRVRPAELLVIAPPAGEPRPDGTARVRP